MANVGILRIGELAERAGVTRDALRYYERLGLLPSSRRTAGGFRLYPASTLESIQFIKQAQAHGLSLSEIRELRGFQDRNGRERCRQVHRLLAQKLGEVDAKVVQLQQFRATLRNYLQQCERALKETAADLECPVVGEFSKDEE